MNKLRENTGVVLWILVISFGVIWVLQDSGAFDVVGTTGTKVGDVNGKPILYEEYQRAVNAQLQSIQDQTGEAAPPQRVDQVRDQVFDMLVEDRLREQEMDRLGIEVTDQEVIDMVVGDDPHPLIKVYFSDGQGGVDRSLLQNFIENPDARQNWLEIEEYLRVERRREKLNKLIESTVRVSDKDVGDEYLRRNRSIDVRYVALRYAALPDDSVSVSDSDLRRFYNEHKEDFARKKTYALAYVSRLKTPTPEDTANVLRDMSLMKDAFTTADDDSLFMARNGSERPYADAYFRRDELDAAIAGYVYEDLTEGRVIGPVITTNEAHLIKIKDVRTSDQPVVHARHILVRAPEGDDAARREARTKAQDLLNQLRRGADFAELARANSDDRSNAAQGGDLGWFGKGRMVAPFEEAALGARIGRVVGPVETQFGYHLIEVLARSDQEVQIADYVQVIRPSVATLNAIESQLDDLQYFATESEDFAGEAERLSLPIQTVTVEEGQQFIPGLGNSRKLTIFLDVGRIGAITEVIELNDRFIVATLTGVQDEGYQPFDQVKAQLESRVKLDKKKALQRQRMEAALRSSGGIDGLAGALGTTERTATSLRLGNPTVAGLGREPSFVGTAFGMKQGETSGVIEGENAVFVLQVMQVIEPDPLSVTEKEQIRTQLLTQRRNQVLNQWIQALRDDADVTDNRRLFLQ